MLAGGITTARDVGSHGRELFELRRAIGARLCPGPRLLLCGQIVSPSSPGGRLFSTMYREADGPDEVRKAVREQIRQGADLIKVMVTGALTVPREAVEPAQMTAEELDAIVEESHRQGFRVAAHAEGLPGIRLAVEAGVDTVEHGEQLHRAPEVLEQMAKRGIVLVPTLSVFELVAEIQSCCFTPTLVDQAKRLREDAFRTVELARAAGVTIVMGFDSSPHGANALELVLLADAGLTPAEAVVAGTSGAAEACGLDDVGRVAPGQLADLLVVSGDPLADVRVLADDAQRWLVLLSGRPVAGRALALNDPFLEVSHG
jgi:imidazolonepropionase-like amidohydrolase